MNIDQAYSIALQARKASRQQTLKNLPAHLTEEHRLAQKYPNFSRQTITNLANAIRQCEDEELALWDVQRKRESELNHAEACHGEYHFDEN